MDALKRKETVDRALQMALDAGASEARIALEENLEYSVIVRNDAVDRLMGASGKTLFIQLYLDGHYGSFSTNMTEESALRDFIREAARQTRLVAPDPCRRLPDAERCFHGPEIDLQQYDPAVESLDNIERIARARAVCAEILGHPKLISVEAEWGDTVEACHMADTQGFSAGYRKSLFTLSANCSIRGKGEEKPESWWYDSDVFSEGVAREGIGRTALERALATLGARKLPSGSYTAIVENTCSAKFVSPLVSALSGSPLQQGTSFLKPHLGGQPFPEWVTLADRPHTPRHYGSRLFDDEGVATRDRHILKEGRIENCFISTYYGLKMGVPATVDSSSVLYFEKNGNIPEKPLSLQDVLKTVGNGVLITGFNGGNHNPATGDFSYGVRGFRVKQGILAEPLNETNITGNFLEMWRRVALIGDDPRKCGRWKIPTLAFSDLSFSGM